MARLPPLRRIDARELGEWSAAWGARLLDRLNQFLVAVHAALDGRLLLGENVDGGYFEFEFSTLAGYAGGSWNELRAVAGRPIQACWVGRIVQLESTYTPILTPVHVDWIQFDGQLHVRYVSGLQASKSYSMRLVALG